MVFSKQFPETITTNLTSTPTFAQFKIENPLKADVFCNGIEVVTTPEFSRKGVMIIRVNGVDLFDSRRTNAFLNVAKMAIPLDAVLERDRFVEIFTFNSVDSNEITCTVTIFLDQISKILDSSFEYLTTEAINDAVSKTESLFPFRVYQNESPPQLLDMEGYKKLIILFASTSIATLVNKSPPHENTYIVGTLGFPSFTTTTTETSGVPFSAVRFTDKTHDITFDLATSTTKKLEIDWDMPSQTTLAGGSQYYLGKQGQPGCIFYINQYNIFFQRKWVVKQSNDETFQTGVIDVSPPLNNVVTSAVNDFTTTLRFLKLTETVIVSFSYETKQLRTSAKCYGAQSQPPHNKLNCADPKGCCDQAGCDGLVERERIIPEPKVKSIHDSLTQEGTAQLSFEVRNKDTGEFNEFITPEEFGTITNGEKVTVQIGDVTSKTAQGKTFALPSTQTDFRAVLTVKGSIETGVTIIKVS